MKKRNWLLNIVLVTCSLLFRLESCAAEVEFHPRLETGVMFYSMELSARSKTIQTIPGESYGQSSGQEKVEFCDTIGFVGGGITFFTGRIFVDLSGQWTFDGSDRSLAASYEYTEGDLNHFASVESEYRGRFDRTDQAIATGYAVTEKLSIFGGYKWAVVDLDTCFDGPATLLNIDNWVASGRYSGSGHDRFRYEGLFIGMMHGSQIAGPGFLHGLISVKLGAAYLQSKLNRNETGTMTFDRLDGWEIEPMTATTVENKEVKGDTVGLTLGVDWRGATPIRNLSYSLGVSGYRYNFSSDDSDFSDITETSVTCKAALGYVF